MYEYERLRRVVYGDEKITFIPVCPHCGRFVKADELLAVNGLGEVLNTPNATCSRCGRVFMPCEGHNV